MNVHGCTARLSCKPGAGDQQRERESWIDPRAGPKGLCIINTIYIILFLASVKLKLLMTTGDFQVQ